LPAPDLVKKVMHGWSLLLLVGFIWGCIISSFVPLLVRARPKRIAAGSFWTVKMLFLHHQPFRASALAAVRTARSLTTSLKNPSLLDFSDRSNKDDSTFEVLNPANGDVIAHIPVMGGDNARVAIEQSHVALQRWRDSTTGIQRGNLLRTWSQLMNENARDLATIMTLESGKPLKESLGEVAYARSFLDFYAGEALRPTSAGGGFLVPTTFKKPNGKPKGQMMAIQQAIGVVGVITPWNFPAAMIARNVAPALAAGCTTVVKPSELTPLTALAMEKLALEAGIPEDVIQVITPDTASTPGVGTEICSNSIIKQVSFTGSTAVGKKLTQQCSATMKRVSMELGGNAPFIVFADADIDQAVEAAMGSKFRNAGQTCVCADRFLVHESVFSEFVDRFATRTASLVVGPGMDKSTDVGPLIAAEACSRVAEKVQEALENGASALVGGTRAEHLGPNFFQPTILTNVSMSSRIWSEETFGPVAAVCSFSDDEEAMRIANDSPVGLAAYFCTESLTRAFEVSRRLECGLVGVNEGVISSSSAPFGGVKESGMGREGSPIGISEYLETKYVFMNV